MQKLAGRMAVVTGGPAASAARSRALRAEHMRVVLADVQRPALEAAAEELRAAGAEVLAVVTDVTVPTT